MACPGRDRIRASPDTARATRPERGGTRESPQDSSVYRRPPGHDVLSVAPPTISDPKRGNPPVGFQHRISGSDVAKVSRMTIRRDSRRACAKPGRQRRRAIRATHRDAGSLLGMSTHRRRQHGLRARVRFGWACGGTRRVAVHDLGGPDPANATTFAYGCFRPVRVTGNSSCLSTGIE